MLANLNKPLLIAFAAFASLIILDNLTAQPLLPGCDQSFTIHPDRK